MHTLQNAEGSWKIKGERAKYKSPLALQKWNNHFEYVLTEDRSQFADIRNE